MPPVAEAPAQVVRHVYDGGWFELVLRQPHPRLSGQVEGTYCGWVESSVHLSHRREVPSGIVPVILNLGPAIGVATPRASMGAIRYFNAFVAGLHDTYAITESSGELAGVQVNFTPLGARRFLGLPMHELTNRVVELEDVLGAQAPRLLDRLREAPGWETRFTILDAFIARRLAAAPTRGTNTPSAAVLWSWQRLHETAGRDPRLRRLLRLDARRAAARPRGGRHQPGSGLRPIPPRHRRQVNSLQDRLTPLA